MLCVKLVFVWVMGLNQMPFSDTLSMIKQAEREFKREGICVQVDRVLKVRDRTSNLTRLEDRYIRFEKWKVWRLRNRLGNNLVHFQLSPMNHIGVNRWMAGSASRTCNPRTGVSWGTGLLVSHEGKPRSLHTRIIFRHEIGHLLGAPHNDDCVGGCGLMHPASAAYASTDMRFKPVDLSHITKCLIGNGYAR